MRCGRCIARRGPECGGDNPAPSSRACRRWMPSRAIGWRRPWSSPTLLAPLNPEDDAPLRAGLVYGTARHQEVRTLDWSPRRPQARRALELAGDEEGRKPGGSWRLVPLVRPLEARLRQAWMAQGKPETRQGLSAVAAAESRASWTSRTCRSARMARWVDHGHGADRAARGAAHGGDLARSRGCLAEGRLDAHGAQDAGVPTGCRGDHAPRRYLHTLPAEPGHARDLPRCLPRSSGRRPSGRSGQRGACSPSHSPAALTARLHRPFDASLCGASPKPLGG